MGNDFDKRVIQTRLYNRGNGSQILKAIVLNGFVVEEKRAEGNLELPESETFPKTC